MFSFDDFRCYVVILPTLDESIPVFDATRCFFDELEVYHKYFIFLLSGGEYYVLEFKIPMKSILRMDRSKTFEDVVC